MHRKDLGPFEPWAGTTHETKAGAQSDTNYTKLGRKYCPMISAVGRDGPTKRAKIGPRPDSWDNLAQVQNEGAA